MSVQKEHGNCFPREDPPHLPTGQKGNQIMEEIKIALTVTLTERQEPGMMESVAIKSGSLVRFQVD